MARRNLCVKLVGQKNWSAKQRRLVNVFSFLIINNPESMYACVIPCLFIPLLEY